MYNNNEDSDMAKSTKRIKAEESIIELMNDLDKSGYNANAYKEYFKTLSNSEFENYMRELANNEDMNLFFEIDSFDYKTVPELPLIEKVAKKHNVSLNEYVAFPHKGTTGEDNQAPISSTPIPVLFVQTRRLQQMLSKKNAATSNIDKINPITGQVTGDSKTASMSDMQTMSLVTSGQIKSIKEFLGPRSDDADAKLKMLNSIERNGEFDIDSLTLKTDDKQSIKTMNVFLTGAGFDVKF